MQNAHERFGTLEFTKRMKDTTTQVRVYIDRAVVEPAKEEKGQASAHLISMIGGDSEIGALWAAVTEAALLQIHLPGRPGITVSLGPEAQCFRGSVAVPGRKRPGRHLVAVSAELAKTKPGTDREGRRTILCDDDPAFVLYRVGCRYGLPVVPEWAPWFMRELNQRKATGMLTSAGERDQACLPQMDRQGAKRRLDPHSERKRLDHLEVAGEFLGAVDCAGSGKLARCPVATSCASERRSGP